MEKARDVNPLNVDPTNVDTFMVLPLSVDTVKQFTFIDDTAALDTVIITPVRVENPMEPPYKLEINAVETRSELPVIVEKIPAFA